MSSVNQESLNSHTLKFIVGDPSRGRTHDSHPDAARVAIWSPAVFYDTHQCGGMVLIHRTQLIYVCGNRVNLCHLALESFVASFSNFLQSTSLHLVNKPDLISAVEKSDTQIVSTSNLS